MSSDTLSLSEQTTWQALQDWLNRDPEGRCLLARLRTDPHGQAAGDLNRPGPDRARLRPGHPLSPARAPAKGYRNLRAKPGYLPRSARSVRGKPDSNSNQPGHRLSQARPPAKGYRPFKQSLDIARDLGDHRDVESQTLTNLGFLYRQQGQEQKAMIFWQEPLMKLHPVSPERKQVIKWLQSGEERRCLSWVYAIVLIFAIIFVAVVLFLFWL